MKRKKTSDAAKSLKARLVRQLTSYNANRHVHDANRHLECYLEDRNPLHILRAVASVAERGRPLSPVMVRNLKHAIALLDNPPRRNGKRPPKNTARNLRVIRLARAYHDGEIPEEMKDDAVTAIARAAKIKEGYVRTIVSRYRQRLKDQPLEIAHSWLTGA